MVTDSEIFYFIFNWYIFKSFLGYFGDLLHCTLCKSFIIATVLVIATVNMVNFFFETFE